MALASSHSTKVLFIGKDPKMSKLIARFLGMHGFDVAQASCGDHAKEASRNHSPAIIIVDIQLPAHDGLQVCKNLRAVCETPILVLSGANDCRSHVQTLESGADDHVIKSVQPRVLLARIRALLRRRSIAEMQPDRLVWTPSPSIAGPARRYGPQDPNRGTFR